MEAVIREAQPADVEPLRALYEELDRYHWEAHPHLFRAHDDPLAARNIADLLESPGYVVFVAESADALVGFAGARLVEVAPDDPIYLRRRFVYVDDMGVTPGFRGRGLAARLLAAIEEWALAQAAVALELTVFEFNEGARRLYERAGFATLQRRMQKPLPRRITATRPES